MFKLNNHPFAVEAFFKSSLVLTFAVPKERLEKLIPECVELDIFKDRWAFIAVAMVQTKSLRPKGFPLFLGSDFFLIGFRVFVRYRTAAGRHLRGLYILKSETDRISMNMLGSLFTRYKYSFTDIESAQSDKTFEVKSVQSGLDLQVDLSSGAKLPPGSPFIDWHEARRFAGPLPFTFSYNKTNREVLIVEGVRENWTPHPVSVTRCQIRFIEELKIDGIVLANAFIIENIPYHWKKGKTEIWDH